MNKDPNLNDESISARQIAFCRSRSAHFEPSPCESKLGFAAVTRGNVPINGLRHPPEAGTNGWYIWCGESLGQDSNFFEPSHTHHIYEEYPELQELLGLAPGYRFLLAGEYLDVWFDASLLDV